jgi:hypothetical protein
MVFLYYLHHPYIRAFAESTGKILSGIGHCYLGLDSRIIKDCRKIEIFMMVISLNLNMWFLRNLNIISNIELYFLKKEDYGELIPEYFHGKKDIHFNRPEVWIFAFFSILIVHSLVYIFSFILFYPEKISKNEFFWISVVFFAGLFLASFFYFYHKAKHNKFLKDAPGHRKREDQYSPKEIEPQNLRLEYKKIGKNMRMYGTLRRQEITLLLILKNADPVTDHR